MIELLYAPTPNGQKISIALEEMGIAYKVTPINIMRGEQFKPEFLAASPNNKIPAMIDAAPADGGAPISVFESGAMLIYLAEKSGKFYPADPRQRADVLQWLMWQMAGLGPMAGQVHHFANYAPEKLPYAIKRFVDEAGRLYGVLDIQLRSRDYVAGDYSIADMAIWPWVAIHDMHQQNFADFPYVSRWFDLVGKRPAVQRGMAVLKDMFSVPMDEEGKKVMFGQQRRNK
jgi:GSH-dependent disulfide-bond oxidoreductase